MFMRRLYSAITSLALVLTFGDLKVEPTPGDAGMVGVVCCGFCIPKIPAIFCFLQWPLLRATNLTRNCTAFNQHKARAGAYNSLMDQALIALRFDFLPATPLMSAKEVAYALNWQFD